MASNSEEAFPAIVSQVGTGLLSVSVSADLHPSLFDDYAKILDKGLRKIDERYTIKSIVPITGFVAWPNGERIAITTKLFVFVGWK